MSGINTGRAAGKSRGRGRSDDVTRSTTDDPDRGAEQSDSPANRSPEDDVDERDTGDRTGSTGRPSTSREEGDEPSRRPDVPDRPDGSRPDSHPSAAPADRGSGEPSGSTSQRGRPAEIRNPQRTTVTLETDQVDFLDNTAARVKLNGGDKLSRGSILRAVLAALMQSGVDLSQADDETSLARLLLDRLDGRR